jgi:membrane-bound lytic murein transglycosylase D
MRVQCRASLMLFLSLIPFSGKAQSEIPGNIGSNYISETSSSNTYEAYLEVLDRQTPVELDYLPEVNYFIEHYLHERSIELELILQRAQLYFPMIEALLDKYGLPLELKYIAVIESRLNPFAKSPSGAVGLWQFLYNTCSMVDLKVDSYIDERRDPYKSTEAACKYLKYLYTTFNDWNLALAAYNGGPRDVRNAIMRSNGHSGYWELRPLLTEQVRNYIPRFIALNYVFNYYYLHGIKEIPAKFTFTNTDTLHINYAVSFAQISTILGIPVNELERLNPAYKRKYIPDLTDPCILVLPADCIVEFLNCEKEILECRLPVSDYKSMLAIAGSTENRTKVLHTVKPGDYYHKIALTYNCTVENIKAWNQLDDSPLYPGQSLAIWIGRNEEQ